MIVGVTQHVKTLSHVCKYAAHHVEREHIVLAIACWDKDQTYEHTCTIIVQCINMQGMILSWQLYVNQNKNHIAHLLIHYYSDVLQPVTCTLQSWYMEHMY